MSTEDELKARGGGPLPTAYEVLAAERNRRADALTLQPGTDEARRWYRAGFEMVAERQINDPVSSVVPAAFRFWYARGLMDAKARGLDMPWLNKAQPTPAPAPEAPQESMVPAVLGAVAGAAGLGLLAWAGLRKRATS